MPIVGVRGSMKINGYQLREAIKAWEFKKTALKAAFEGTLTKFPDEVKENPLTAMSRLEEAENAIATLQTAQLIYNLKVTVPVEPTGEGTRPATLAEAIKLVGVASRMEATWKGALPQEHPRYLRERNRETVVAVSTLTSQEVIAESTIAGRYASKLRALVSAANAREVEIDLYGLTPALFE